MKETVESHVGRVRGGRRASRKSRTRVSGRRSPVARQSVSRSLKEISGSDVERFVRKNASALTLVGMTLGVFVSKKFLILPVAVTATLLQDVLSDSLRRLGRKSR